MSTAEEFKQKGNDFYKTSNFVKAEVAYTTALNTLKDEENNPKLRVALYSNRGNARFELGNYKGAAQDSRDVIDTIITTNNDLNIDDATTEENDKKIELNKLRLVRSLYYLKSDESELNNLILTMKDPSLQKKCKMILDSIDYAKKINTPELKFTPQLTRSSLSFPYCEYYPFGHDEAESALNGMDIKPNSKINVLYGGVGDGRHVLATILEANYRNEKGGLEMKLHVSMNDINTTLLLKDILVLVLLYRIGNTKDIDMYSGNILKELEKHQEAYLLMSLLYYGTLSYSMPPSIYLKLQNLLKEIFIDMTCESFNQKYPWLYVPVSTCWSKVQRVAKYWIDISLYDPPLKNVKHCLNTFKPSFESADDMFANLEASGVSPFQIEQMKRQKEENDAIKRKAISDIIDKNLSGDPSVPINNDVVSQFIPENATSEEKRIGKELMIDFFLKMENEQGLEFELDTIFMKGTSTLLPVGINSIPDMKSEYKMRSSIQEAFGGHVRGGLGNNDKTRLQQAIQKAKEEIHKKWHVNPMKFCPDWNEVGYKNNESDPTNPVKEFPNHFLHDQIHDFILSGAGKDIFNIKVDDSLFDIFALFYINASFAIAKLVKQGNLSIEISLGSILDFANDIVAESDVRTKLNLPVSFEEVILSNVPDYTGMLSTFVQIGPILNRQTEVPSNFRSNVLLNTGLFQNYDQYVFGSTALSVSGISRILKQCCLEEKPDAWNDFNRWTFNKEDPVKPVTYLEFKTWIHRLFLNTVLPPARNSQAAVREEHPNTMMLLL